MKHMFFLMLIVTVLAGCEKPKKAQQESVVNDLPAMLIHTTKGEQIFTKNLSGKTILILFQPDCDHCQREARQIRDSLSAFADYELYFISTVSKEALEEFSDEYQFSSETSVHFATTSFDNIISSFGSIDAPSAFVYSAEGNLIKHFNGEVDISEILKVL